ncbi:hypothetical protein BDZ89DRAFT_1161785 [Hymenopellis radicata]|nr:hypothetical protein BDZ89DRAFT_1161785 [Hymenopellis radicata]
MAGKNSPSKEKTPDEPQSENDEEGDEEEYEIEEILDVDPEAFDGEKTGYWVKWKNYDDKFNTWVSEEDAGNAQELIDEFWRKRREEKAKDPKKKRSRPSNGDSASARGSAKRSRKQSTAMDEDDEEEVDTQPKKARSTSTKATTKSTTTNAARKSTAKQQSPSEAAVDILEISHVVQYKDLKNWDKVVEEITTVERDVESQQLYIFFTLQVLPYLHFPLLTLCPAFYDRNTGERVRAESSECRYKFPQKLIDFYESHLKWTETEA